MVLIEKIDLDPKICNFYPIFDPAGLILRQITETDLEEWLFKSKKLFSKFFLSLPMLPLLLMMIANKVVLTLTSPIFRIICPRI